MRCPNCGRRASWARTRCAACKTKLVAWYVVVVTAVLVAGVAAWYLLETLA
ncbi:MAG: hypothetical protein QOD33_1206 [Pyrinomonadaceae bacterium]|nr:hypothetical protein [Pyrinomonadaceae bacterium]